MLLISSSQSQELDTRSMTEFSIPSEQLMSAAAREILQSLRTEFAKDHKFHLVILLVGPGRNGGDAVLVKKHWSEYFSSHPEFLEIRKDSMPAHKIPLDGDVIIDGFFGTGLARDVRGYYGDVLERLSRSHAFKLAVDLPSGLDADTGQIRGHAMKADMTVTFGASKPGLHQMKGPRIAGRVRVAGLIFPKSLLREIATDLRAFGNKAAKRLMPPRPLEGHKGSFGQVYLFAGSEKYRGAGILCARAALSAGAGYVHMISDDEIYPGLMQLPEVIYHRTNEFDFSRLLRKNAVVVVGPGYANPDSLRLVVKKLLDMNVEKVLLDAEAFPHIEDGRFEGRRLPETWILTPHPGELAQLMGTTSEAVNLDRLASGEIAQEKLKCVLLLKGFRSWVFDQKLKTIILAGNSALGKAGSGDVLAGIIAAFWTQNLKPRDAALLGAYVHGRVGSDYVREGNDAATLIPSRIIDFLPYVMKAVRAGSIPGPKTRHKKSHSHT